MCRKKGCTHFIQIKCSYLDDLRGLRSGVVIVDPLPGTGGDWKGAEEQELAPIPGRHCGQGLRASHYDDPLPHFVRAFTLSGKIPASQSPCDTPWEKKNDTKA